MKHLKEKVYVKNANLDDLLINKPMAFQIVFLLITNKG